MTKLPFSLPYIRWADVAIIASPGIVSQRRLYDHEFVYVLRGAGQIEVDETAHDAKPNRLFLIQPRVWHCFRPATDKYLHLLGVHFDWVPQHDSLSFPIFTPASEPINESKFRAPREVPGWHLRVQPFLDFPGNQDVGRAFETVVDEFQTRDEESRELAGSILATTILRIAREVREMHLREQSTLVGADAMRRAQRARAMLEETTQPLVSVEEAAAHVGWSGDHLRRIFRQVFETAPARIQMLARLRLARQLLRHEERPIAEIGQMCGFEDASHFTRVFKSHTKLTPNQYLHLAKRR